MLLFRERQQRKLHPDGIQFFMSFVSAVVIWHYLKISSTIILRGITSRFIFFTFLNYDDRHVQLRDSYAVLICDHPVE
jgi:hypothetical protein